MSVPITHASTSTPRALDEEAPKASQWRRQVIGIVGGLALALLAFFLFPASGVDQVMKSPPLRLARTSSPSPTSVCGSSSSRRSSSESGG